MQSDDKRYLGQMLATLDTYRTSVSMPRGVDRKSVV